MQEDIRQSSYRTDNDSMNNYGGVVYNLKNKSLSIYEMLEGCNKDYLQDVTLVSEEGIHTKSHRVVISSCSSYLKTLLVSHPHPHALIHLTGVPDNVIQLMLKFIYTGEVQVGLADIESLLAASKELRVKGLNPNSEEEDDVERQSVDNNTEESGDRFLKSKEELTKPVDFVDPFDPFNSSGGQVVESLLKIEHGTPGTVSPTTPKKKTRVLKCEMCEIVFGTYQGLRDHKKSKHLGVRYPCTHCDYQATQKQNLKLHFDSRHAGVRYPCMHCEYKATNKGNLNSHVKSVHLGVKWPCKICDFKFTDQSALRRHMKSKHSGSSEPLALTLESKQQKQQQQHQYPPQWSSFLGLPFPVPHNMSNALPNHQNLNAAFPLAGHSHNLDAGDDPSLAGLQGRPLVATAPAEPAHPQPLL